MVNGHCTRWDPSLVLVFINYMTGENVDTLRMSCYHFDGSTADIETGATFKLNLGCYMKNGGTLFLHEKHIYSLQLLLVICISTQSNKPKAIRYYRESECWYIHL